MEVDGRRERREPSVTVSTTSAADADAPTIDAVRGVMDADPTTIVTDPLILVVVRILLRGMPPPSVALTGTWRPAGRGDTRLRLEALTSAASNAPGPRERPS